MKGLKDLRIEGMLLPPFLLAILVFLVILAANLQRVAAIVFLNCLYYGHMVASMSRILATWLH